MDFQLDEVKVIECKECGVDVPVNINYPIDSVTCLKCWAKKKSDEKWQKFVKPIHVVAWTQIPPMGALVVQFVQSRTGPGSCKPLVLLGS